jgi:hypothetical protein
MAGKSMSHVARTAVMLLVVLAFAVGCDQSRVAGEQKDSMAPKIRKFEDDDAICYTFWQDAISCIAKGKKQ